MYEFFSALIPNVMKNLPELQKSILQTLEMVGLSALWSCAFGIVFGVLGIIFAIMSKKGDKMDGQARAGLAQRDPVILGGGDHMHGLRWRAWAVGLGRE